MTKLAELNRKLVGNIPYTILAKKDLLYDGEKYLVELVSKACQIKHRQDSRHFQIKIDVEYNLPHILDKGVVLHNNVSNFTTSDYTNSIYVDDIRYVLDFRINLSIYHQQYDSFYLPYIENIENTIFSKAMGSLRTSYGDKLSTMVFKSLIKKPNQYDSFKWASKRYYNEANS